MRRETFYSDRWKYSLSMSLTGLPEEVGLVFIYE